MKTNETNQFDVKTVALNKDEQALFLVPDLANQQSLAVIDTGVLKYLTSLLPTADYYEILKGFKDSLIGVDNLEQLVATAKEFVVFHESVNLLARFFDKNTVVVEQAPFNVEKPIELDKIMIEEGFVKEGDNWMKLKSVEA